MTNNIEKVTIDHSVNLNEFLLCLDLADKAETVRFNETERAINLLKLMRNQYSTLQDGRSIGKPPQAGEMPAAMYHEVIQGIYNYKKQTAEQQNQEFNLNYDNYRDYQVKQLKYYIETGDLLNNKKSTLQERAMITIDKLEKKAAAEAKAAEAAKAKAAKAAADKAKAEAKAAEAKAAADKLAEAAEAAADNINTKDEAEVFLDIVEQSEAAADDAEAKAVEAKAKAEAEAKAAKAEAEAEAKAKAAADKLAGAKARAEALARGKTEPKPDLSNIEFSKDCRAEMTDVLNQLSNDYSEVELLCLASLIRKRYTPSKA